MSVFMRCLYAFLWVSNMPPRPFIFNMSREVTLCFVGAETEMEDLLGSHTLYELPGQDDHASTVFTVRTVPGGPISAPRLLAAKSCLRNRKRDDSAIAETGTFFVTLHFQRL